MLKRVAWTITGAVLLTFGLPAVASAHVLKFDGNIGAVLHIDPDDNPTTGHPASYVLSMTDDTSRLDISKCDCKVNILEGGKIIYSHPMQVTDETDSIDTYTFQQPDVYTMEFIGTPNTPGAFQSFKLDYELRVGQAASTHQIPILLWIGNGMIIELILLVAYAMRYDSDELTKKSNRSHQ